MTELESFNFLVGQLLPLIIGYLKNNLPEKPLVLNISNSFIVTIVMSLLIGAGTAYYSGDLSGNIIISLATIFTSSQIAYRTWFKESGLEKSISRKN